MIADIDIELQLTADDCDRIRELALENARALGLTDDEWQRRRRVERPVVADILMAFDPKPVQIATDQMKASSRPLGHLRIEALIAELQDARRCRDTLRLRRLLDELAHRRTRLAARFAASVRLSLLAIERPEVLPFLVE